MTKYVRVKEAPTNLPDKCYIIDAPNFFNEIEQCSGRLPKSKHMTANFLRDVVGLAGNKYLPETFDVLRDLNASLYNGVPFSDVKEAHDIIMRCVRASCPQLLEAYVEYYIKKRPFGTKLIYFLGDFADTAPFSKHGIDSIKVSQIDKFLGLKKNLLNIRKTSKE